jgi:cyclophilin family peptidyl-prolyl cis-trans isomerase
MASAVPHRRLQGIRPRVRRRPRRRRYRPAMAHRRRSPSPSALLAVVALLAAPLALPAQGKAGKDKAGKERDKAVAAAPKDDALTAKDPAIVAIDKFRKAKVSTKSADWKKALPKPPQLPFDAGRAYRWHLETSVGPLVVTLLPDAAPMHCSSVVYLSRCGFYDGLQFPRVLKGFMAQGGSPDSTQAGDAGYKLDGELKSGQKHDKPGALSSANDGNPNNEGSQFFLTFVPTPHLDGKHTVHGFVTEGLETTLKKLEEQGVDKDGDPLPEKVTILRTWITVVGKDGGGGEETKAGAKGGEKPSGK